MTPVLQLSKKFLPAVFLLVFLHSMSLAENFRGVYVGEVGLHRLVLSLKPAPLLGYNVSGTVLYKYGEGADEEIFGYPVTGKYHPKVNKIVGRVRYQGEEDPGFKGRYNKKEKAFIVTLSGIKFTCYKMKKGQPIKTPTPEPTLTPYEYWVVRLTNASDGLYIGSEQSLYHRLRCGFEGGGVNCGATDYVTYAKLFGPYETRSKAEYALCTNIAEKRVFPLGIGLKARFLNSTAWYGMWDGSVAALCPNIPTSYP